MARRRTNVFSLSFLDAMTCGFGAVVLLYMVINSSVSMRAGHVTRDLRGEVDFLEVEVLEENEDLVKTFAAERRDPLAGTQRDDRYIGDQQDPYQHDGRKRQN